MSTVAGTVDEAKAKASAEQQNILVVMTTGTENPNKTNVAVLTIFGLRKQGHTVNVLQMADAGSVVALEQLAAIQGFGLPSVKELLAAEEMADVIWFVWGFCAKARNKTEDMLGRKGKIVDAVTSTELMVAADKVLTF